MLHPLEVYGHVLIGAHCAALSLQDAALALHKETFLKRSGSSAAEPGGVLHALGPLLGSSPNFLCQFERSLADDFKPDILIGLVYSPWRGMGQQGRSRKSVESECFPILGRASKFPVFIPPLPLHAVSI